MRTGSSAASWPRTAATVRTCWAGCGRRATLRRIAPCAVSGTISDTAAPRAAARRAISDTKSGLPLVRPATAAASSGPTCCPPVAAIRAATSSDPRPASGQDSPAAAISAARRSRSDPATTSWSRQPQTTSTGRVARLGSRNRSRCRLPVSAQCRSSSSSTTGNSLVMPSRTASTPSKSGKRLAGCGSLSPLASGSTSSAARRARGPPSVTSACGSPVPAWRRTWVQSQNAGAPVASSAAVPRSTVAPALRARSPISVRTLDLPMPASPRTQSRPPVPPRSAATSTSARSRTAARPSSTDPG